MQIVSRKNSFLLPDKFNLQPKPESIVINDTVGNTGSLI